MLGIYVHAPDVSEVGGFYMADISAALKELATRIKTQFAFATTVSAQKPAEDALRADGWVDLGHRYNQLHAPNFITLWSREYPANKTAQTPMTTRVGWTHGGGWNPQAPPYGAYSCGIWFASPNFADPGSDNLLTTKWLAVWRLPNKLLRHNAGELERNGWKHVGDSEIGGSIWHTAEPHDVLNRYGK